MKVKDLLKRLKDYDPDSLVVLSADEEGNAYNKASCIEAYLFKDGEICLEEELEEDHDWVRSVVIWP
jgi:hypothetical protein